MEEKIVQLKQMWLPGMEEPFEAVFKKYMTAFFAQNTAIKNELKCLKNRNNELEEVVFRLAGRFDRVIDQQVSNA